VNETELPQGQHVLTDFYEILPDYVLTHSREICTHTPGKGNSSTILRASHSRRSVEDDN